jgi:hypothetical protein
LVNGQTRAFYAKKSIEKHIKEAVPSKPGYTASKKHHTLVKFPFSNYYKPQIDKRT